MPNPLSSLIPKDTETGSDPNGLAGRMESQKSAEDALKGPTPVKSTGGPIMDKGGPYKIDKGGQGPYGSRPGEKRIDVGPMLKPLGQMHKGGVVPQTGAYIMKKGEHVLTPEHADHLKTAMSLASSALSHEPDEDKKPAKVVKEMHIRPTANGGFIAKHIHQHFEHPDEEHVHPDMDSLHDHLEQHWGAPNDGENESESEKDESPGVKEIAKAVGFAKPNRYDEGGTVQKTGMALVHAGEKVTPVNKTPDFNPMAKSGPKESDFKSASYPDPRTGGGTKSPDFNPIRSGPKASDFYADK